MKKGFINILLYLFFPAIVTIMFYSKLNSNNFTYFIFTTLPYLLLFAYFIYKYKNIFIKDVKKINKKNIVITIVFWIIGFLLMMLANYVINYIIFENGISANEEMNRNLLFKHKITYSFLMCLILPILEEISFRLEFKNNIKKEINFILLSSFLFSLAHIISITSLIEIIYLIPYFILGVAFSIIYVKTDNIYMNILAHIIHNTLCVIIILLF